MTALSDEFETFVNGEVIRAEKRIYNGDRVVIGGSHYFRVNNPHCSKRFSATETVWDMVELPFFFLLIFHPFVG